MQQQLNEYRVKGDKMRDEMMQEHCEELDDLVSRFSSERKGLHDEIRELRAQCAKAEVGGAAERPMSEIRAHFESQVAVMKRELVAQLSDVHERERQQRGVDERELKQLQQSLEETQKDFASSQEEFTILSTLFDKERREHLSLKLRLERFADTDVEAVKFAAAVAEHRPPVQMQVPQQLASLPAPVLPPQVSGPIPIMAMAPMPMLATATMATMPVMPISNQTMPNHDMTPDTTTSFDTQMLYLPLREDGGQAAFKDIDAFVDSCWSAVGLSGAAHQSTQQQLAQAAERPLAERAGSSVPTESPSVTPTTNPTFNTPSQGIPIGGAAFVQPPIASSAGGLATPKAPTPGALGQRFGGMPIPGAPMTGTVSTSAAGTPPVVTTPLTAAVSNAAAAASALASAASALATGSQLKVASQR
jgi:hypothetical protein